MYNYKTGSLLSYSFYCVLDGDMKEVHGVKSLIWISKLPARRVGLFEMVMTGIIYKTERKSARDAQVDTLTWPTDLKVARELKLINS